MVGILGIPNFQSQGIPNPANVRLAYMKTWHERLRHAREQTQLRAVQVANEVGVSSATYSDWESGAIKKIEGENLLKVCAALNINPQWLIFGKGQMRISSPYDMITDEWARTVLRAMENMPDYKKDVMVATSRTLAEPPPERPTNDREK